MQLINDIRFVFYWRRTDEDLWLVSHPVSLGELIDGDTELELSNGDSLPLSDIDWRRDQVRVAQI